MREAAVLRIILQIHASVRTDEEGKEGDGCGKTSWELWNLSRYELRADAGVGREKGRGSLGTVTEEELAGSEAPGRGSNQDRNLGSYALPSSPRSLRRGKGRQQRF